MEGPNLVHREVGPHLLWSIGDSVHLDWRTPGGAFPVVSRSEGELPPCALPSV